MNLNQNLSEIEDLQPRTNHGYLSIAKQEDRKAAEKYAPVKQKMDDYLYMKEVEDILNETKHLEI